MGNINTDDFLKNESMIRISEITIETLDCLKKTFDCRAHAAKEWLKWTGSDPLSTERRRECENAIGWCNRHIQSQIS